MNPLIRFKTTTLLRLIGCVLGCVALLPIAQAVFPPPDGFYPDGNTAEGHDALFSDILGAGNYNTALGFHALYSNATGLSNTATGNSALAGNVNGVNNTADGANALQHNSSGSWNTATGYQALWTNSFGFYNTADGANALVHNKTGNRNTAVGISALRANESADNNTAVGNNALFYNTASYNTAIGDGALVTNSTGLGNTAVGYQALMNNTDAGGNTAVGAQALFHKSGGARPPSHVTGNTAVGSLALYNNIGAFNTAVGDLALYNNTGTFNIAIGSNAGTNLTTGNDNIDIGNVGVAGESKRIRIGEVGTHSAAFIAGIFTSTVTGPAVAVNGNGRLGVATSSARFKDEIKPMDKSSEAILALKPVSFRYKKEIDPERTPQCGLVAEDVEKVNPDLVARDKEGKPYSVRYDQVNAMLLNEFLKEHRKVEKLEATITRLQKGMETVVARLEEQESQLQKVTAQLETNKPVVRMVLNNQ